MEQVSWGPSLGHFWLDFWWFLGFHSSSWRRFNHHGTHELAGGFLRKWPAGVIDRKQDLLEEPKATGVFSGDVQSTAKRVVFSFICPFVSCKRVVSTWVVGHAAWVISIASEFSWYRYAVDFTADQCLLGTWNPKKRPDQLAWEHTFSFGTIPVVVKVFVKHAELLGWVFPPVGSTSRGVARWLVALWGWWWSALGWCSSSCHLGSSSL